MLTFLANPLRTRPTPLHAARLRVSRQVYCAKREIDSRGGWGGLGAEHEVQGEGCRARSAHDAQRGGTEGEHKRGSCVRKIMKTFESSEGHARLLRATE